MKEVTEWNVVCTLKVTILLTRRKADRGSLHKKNFRGAVYNTTEHLFISMLEKICIFPLVLKPRTYFFTAYFIDNFQNWNFNSARHDWKELIFFQWVLKHWSEKNFLLIKNDYDIMTAEAHSCAPSCKKWIPQMTEEIICYRIKTR